MAHDAATEVSGKLVIRNIGLFLFDCCGYRLLYKTYPPYENDGILKPAESCAPVAPDIRSGLGFSRACR